MDFEKRKAAAAAASQQVLGMCLACGFRADSTMTADWGDSSVSIVHLTCEQFAQGDIEILMLGCSLFIKGPPSFIQVSSR